jgi:16S rRNA (guanine527-N7)-methyltransferase
MHSNTPPEKEASWPIEPIERETGFVCDASARLALVTWLDLLWQWNARIDLTAARTREAIADVMLTDALVMAANVPVGARVIDVGTGAGAPGLPLALIRPDLRVTLVEPMAKRAAFLRTVMGSVGRADILLERGHGEDIRAKGLQFDVAVARATLAPPAWLSLGAALAAPEGSVWVLLAKEPPPTHPQWIVAETFHYVWPHSGGGRRALRYRFGS